MLVRSLDRNLISRTRLLLSHCRTMAHSLGGPETKDAYFVAVHGARKAEQNHHPKIVYVQSESSLPYRIIRAVGISCNGRASRYSSQRHQHRYHNSARRKHPEVESLLKSVKEAPTSVRIVLEEIKALRLVLDEINESVRHNELSGSRKSTAPEQS